MEDTSITDVTAKAQPQTGATAEQVLEVSARLHNLAATYFFVREMASNAESGGITIHCKMMNGSNYQLAINSNMLGAALTEELNKLVEGLKADGIAISDFMQKLAKQYESSKPS